MATTSSHALHIPARRRVLIVDDAADIRSILAALLGEEDYPIGEAATGAETLAAMREEPYDLVLLDLNLPDMKGFEVCAEIHRLPRCRSTPVIFISGYDDARTRVQCFQAGGADLGLSAQ